MFISESHVVQAFQFAKVTQKNKLSFIFVVFYIIKV